MLKTDKIERLIELSLLSGYVKDDYAPLSLILISYPETAKTSMILKFNCPHTIETADLSAKPIADFIVPKLRNNELHHIIVPDMVKVLAHRDTTVQSTIGFLNALMEEGIKQNLFFGQQFEFDDRKKCGLITSVTYDFFFKMFRAWRSIGFTSRFIPVSFKYAEDTVINIHKSISENVVYEELVKMKKIRRKKIGLPKEIGAFISITAQDMVAKQKKDKIRVTVQAGKQKFIPIEIYGFRLHKQLRKLACSIALSHGQNVVTWENIEELKELLEYIRLPKNPKEI